MKIPILQDNCPDWHHKCNAECCRMFTITEQTPKRYRPNTLVSFTLKNMTPDQKWYYELHNCKVQNNTITLRMPKNTLVNNKLVIYKKCTLLNDNNMCDGHPNNKPDLCKNMNRTESRTNNYYLTPNCRFNHEVQE